MPSITLTPQTFTSHEYLENDAEWANPGNAAASDDAYAVATRANEESPYTETLRCTNMDNATDIPVDAYFVGLRLFIEHKAVSSDDVFDHRIQLFTAGAHYLGDDKKDTEEAWPAEDEVVAYGADDDTWGDHGMSVADFRGSTWGIGINVTGVMGTDFSIDHVYFKFYYEAGGIADLCVYDNDNQGAEVDSGDTIDFGTYQTGQSVTRQLTLTNEGTADLIIGTCSASDDLSILATDDPSDQTLAYRSGPVFMHRQHTPDDTLPTGTETITVEMDTATAGSKTGTLTIPSNDPDTPFLIDFICEVEDDADPVEPCVERYRSSMKRNSRHLC